MSFDTIRYFNDDMEAGHLKKFVHEHFFENHENGILMRHKLLLEVPYEYPGNRLQDFF